MDGLIAYALSKKYADEVGRSILDAGFKTQVEQDRSILQTTGQEKILYFIPKTTAKPSDGYDEYVYSNNAWEQVGATDVDLNYELLSNKPQINGVTLLGNKTAKALGLQDKNITIGGYPPVGSSTEYPYNYFWLDTTNYSLYTLIDIDPTHAPREYFYRWQRLTYQSIVSTEIPPERSGNNVDKRYFPGDVWVQTNANNTQVIDTFVCVAWQRVTIDYITWYYKYTWLKINATIQSATVNSNGTIMFTMSDGSTVTTTGQSVIGPQGDDYILTAQDKADIANIVLQLLPNADTMTFPIASEVNT